MKLSNHTIIVNDYPEANQYLVYNTRTQALVKIDQNLKNVLDRLSQNGRAVSSDYQTQLEHFYKMGILVRDEQEDFNRLKAHLNQLKYSYDRSRFMATILTTYACNFKCVYCFEESSRENVKLNFETQELVIGWLKRRVQRLGYKGLLLNYYGGEPLLNPAAIEHISGEMKQWCASQGIDFAITMQTNGYLMTPELIDKLNKFNLQKVRISIDGVKENHDHKRPLRGGGSTFDRIIKNIKDCVDKVEICISVGYEGDHIEPIEQLIAYFKELGILRKLGQFICSPIHPTLGPKGNPTSIQGSECMCGHEDKTMASAARKIKELMVQNGLPYKSGMSTAACTLVRENSGVIIDQHGRLYRCNSLLGHSEFAIGDVRYDEFNEMQKEFRDLDVYRQCPTDCTYLPMCSGGCRLMSFVGGNKNFKVASCKKPYLNEMAPEFIKRDYDRMVAQKQEREKKAVMV